MIDKLALFDENYEWAKSLSVKTNGRQLPVDVAINCGLVGLWEAVSRNDGRNFRSYAAVKIKGAVLDEVRREAIYRRRNRTGIYGGRI